MVDPWWITGYFKKDHWEPNSLTGADCKLAPGGISQVLHALVPAEPDVAGFVYREAASEQGPNLCIQSKQHAAYTKHIGGHDVHILVSLPPVRKNCLYHLP